MMSREETLLHLFSLLTSGIQINLSKVSLFFGSTDNNAKTDLLALLNYLQTNTVMVFLSVFVAPSITQLTRICAPATELLIKVQWSDNNLL